MDPKPFPQDSISMCKKTFRFLQFPSHYCVTLFHLTTISSLSLYEDCVWTKSTQIYLLSSWWDAMENVCLSFSLRTLLMIKRAGWAYQHQLKLSAEFRNAAYKLCLLKHFKIKVHSMRFIILSKLIPTSSAGLQKKVQSVERIKNFLIFLAKLFTRNISHWFMIFASFDLILLPRIPWFALVIMNGIKMSRRMERAYVRANFQFRMDFIASDGSFSVSME